MYIGQDYVAHQITRDRQDRFRLVSQHTGKYLTGELTFAELQRYHRLHVLQEAILAFRSHEEDPTTLDYFKVGMWDSEHVEIPGPKSEWETETTRLAEIALQALESELPKFPEE